MSDLLEQAQEAARQGNWTLLHQYVQQLEMSNQVNELLQVVGVEPLLVMAMAALVEGDFQDRWEVARVFPRLGESAIAPLVELLQDDEADLEARWFAARILKEFKTPVTIQALLQVLKTSTDEDLSLMAAEALTAQEKEAIAALTQLLANDHTRFLGVRSLAQLPTAETISPLLTVVDDSQPTVRALAIEALGNFQDPRVKPVLVSALTDSAVAVRRVAVTALRGWTGSADATDLVNRLADRLWDLNLEVCQQAAIALGRIGTDAAVEQLCRVLRSPHTPLPLQIETIRALGWTGTATALDALQQVLVAPPKGLQVPETVVQEIVHMLGRWPTPALRSRATQILLETISPNAATAKAPIFHAKDIKNAIALALGQLGQVQALEPLTHLLADRDPSVRLHVVAALKTLDAQASRQRLEALAAQGNLSEAMQAGVAIALQEWDP